MSATTTTILEPGVSYSTRENQSPTQCSWKAPDAWVASKSSHEASIDRLGPRDIELMPVGIEEPRINTVSVKETWRAPGINLARMAAVWLAFFNLGIHDAAFGPLIPSLEKYYGLNYTLVSLVFLATFPGYILAATTSDRLHQWVGHRGIAGIASTFRIATYIALACHPPWAVIIVLLVFCGWGNGLLDAAWNIWVAELEHPNELLGFLHGLYGLGAAIAPIIASSMVDKYNLPWFQFYYVAIGLAVLELVAGVSAFWTATGAEFRRHNTSEGNTTGENEKGRTREGLKMRVAWQVAIFLLLYVGAEVSLSGWIVTFMLRVRNGQPFPAAMVSTGFWLGITVGRLILGFVTARLGERWAVVGYLAIGIALELIFWLVPDFVTSAVAVALLGFFLGPIFPTAVIVLQKLLPRHLHVGVISFAAAVGMGGAAVLPFAVGAIASARGVQVLQPIILALIVLLIVLWITLPKIPKPAKAE